MPAYLCDIHVITGAALLAINSIYALYLFGIPIESMPFLCEGPSQD